MGSWQKELNVDPIPELLNVENEAINYFTKRDLLDKKIEPIEILWKLPEVEKILKKQQSDGSWKYPGGNKHIRSEENYDQIETYRILSYLIEKYGFNREHKAIQRAAEFFFHFQSEEGDFRGIYAHQYSTTYSPAIMGLLINAGYENDPHIQKGFHWLLKIKQEDGGWVIPFRTVRKNIKDALNCPEPIQPDKSKPFSHLVTAMVLRAFAAHPKYQKSEEAKKAGELVISRFFKNDKYPDRKNKIFWERVGFPFWFTDIISALDSLYFLGFNINNSGIKEGLDFLREKQMKNGNFNLKITRGSDKDLPYWICLAVCRLFKRYYG
ncbi:MAG: prenyltransferase/squalene oxidase repeat-containing protein [Methanobacterium sp.]